MIGIERVEDYVSVTPPFNDHLLIVDLPLSFQNEKNTLVNRRQKSKHRVNYKNRCIGSNTENRRNNLSVPKHGSKKENKASTPGINYWMDDYRH